MNNKTCKCGITHPYSAFKDGHLWQMPKPITDLLLINCECGSTIAIKRRDYLYDLRLRRETRQAEAEVRRAEEEQMDDEVMEEEHPSYGGHDL